LISTSTPTWMPVRTPYAAPNFRHPDEHDDAELLGPAEVSPRSQSLDPGNPPVPDA
jgi:hypothetical protein